MANPPITRLTGLVIDSTDAAPNTSIFTVPSLTATQIAALPTTVIAGLEPVLVNGSIVYNETINAFQLYQNGTLISFSVPGAIPSYATDAAAITAGLGVAGGIYFNTTSAILRYYNGIVFENVATWGYTNVAATPYQALITDSFISVDTAAIAGASAITLPAIASMTRGKIITVSDRTGQGAANNITVSSAALINGNAGYVINTNYGYVQVVAVGNNAGVPTTWNIIDSSAAIPFVGLQQFATDTDAEAAGLTNMGDLYFNTTSDIARIYNSVNFVSLASENITYNGVSNYQILVTDEIIAQEDAGGLNTPWTITLPHIADTQPGQRFTIVDESFRLGAGYSIKVVSLDSTPINSSIDPYYITTSGGYLTVASSITSVAWDIVSESVPLSNFDNDTDALASGNNLQFSGSQYFDYTSGVIRFNNSQGSSNFVSLANWGVGTQSGTYQMLVTDVLIAATATNSVITLPALSAVQRGQVFRIADITGNASPSTPITIKTGDGSTINGIAGTTGYQIIAPYGFAEFYSTAVPTDDDAIEWFTFSAVPLTILPRVDDNGNAGEIGLGANGSEYYNTTYNVIMQVVNGDWNPQSLLPNFATDADATTAGFNGAKGIQYYNTTVNLVRFWNGTIFEPITVLNSTIAVGSYLVTPTDTLIAVLSAAGATTVTLPNLGGGLIGTGQIFTIVDQSGQAAVPGNLITVTTGDASTINGSTTYLINTNGGYLTVASNGASWDIIGANEQPGLTTTAGATYTVKVTDSLVTNSDSSAVPVTITLPVIAPTPGPFNTITPGQIFEIKATTVNTSGITVTTSDSTTIDGAATVAITAPYGFARFFSNGTNWFTV